MNKIDYDDFGNLVYYSTIEVWSQHPIPHRLHRYFAANRTTSHRPRLTLVDESYIPCVAPPEIEGVHHGLWSIERSAQRIEKHRRYVDLRECLQRMRKLESRLKRIQRRYENLTGEPVTTSVKLHLL
jgi:hypothetical protein